ncbi:MAG: hypothetical protein K1X29_08825 [Bdellovibrionales bacterium]|nr:hypothetical protein [Bdellovibrionales bacterium]
MSHLEISAVLSGSRTEVFDLLRSPNLLPELLKDHIEVEIVRGAEELKKGSEYEFLMTRFGLTQPVRIRVEDFIQGNRLTYKQVEGLFSNWTHTMKFEDHGDKQTLVIDYVDYDMPFGLVGHLADDLFIRKNMKNILETRLKRAGEQIVLQKGV